MDYQGIFVQGGSGDNPTPDLENVMRYKEEWDNSRVYNVDDVVIYFEKQYISKILNINKRPDENTNEWDIISYWGNNNTISSFRGSYIQGLVLKQYDSVYDPVTQDTYMNYGPNNYTITTLANLLRDLRRINNPNSLLPLNFNQSYMFANGGDSTQFLGGITYDGTPPGSPLVLNTYPTLPNFKTNGWKRGNADGTFSLDPTNIYSKEGLYKFTATINYWLCRVPSTSTSLNSNGSGSIAIQAASDGFIIDSSGLSAPITQPSLTGYFNSNQITLSGTHNVRFGDQYGIRLTNINFRGETWGFAIRLGIEYLSPSDPVDIRHDYVGLSRTSSDYPRDTIEILTRPVQPEYIIPYPIVHYLLPDSVDTSLIDTPNNPYTKYTYRDSKCIRLNSYPNLNTLYTLTLSSSIGLIFESDDLLEVRACFQSSVNNIDWVDISERVLIFSNLETSLTFIENIPVYIQYESFRPNFQLSYQYVRPVLIVIPKPDLVSFTNTLTILSNGGVDFPPIPDFMRYQPYNSFFQMYPSVPVSSNVSFQQTHQNTSSDYKIVIRNGNGLNPENLYGLPSAFMFLPIVINNYQFNVDTCRSVNNQPIIFNQQNTLQNNYGPYWCGVKLQTSNNYRFDYTIQGKFLGSSVFGLADFRLVFCRNNPCQIIYTSPILNVANDGTVDQTISHSTTLINAGDFIYALITWTPLFIVGNVTGFNVGSRNLFIVDPN